MEGKGAQEILLHRIVFHKLGWQLYEVPPYIGARKTLETGVGKHAVEAVTKLVEEGLYLAQGQEGWLLGGRLGEVHHHADVRAHIGALVIYPLSLELCHPGTSLLALAREEVCIEYCQIAAILIEYLVCLDIRMIDRDVLVLLEGDAVELVGKTEYAINHLIELEIRTKHLCIEIVLLHLELMRIESEIPWLHLEIIALQFLCECLHLCRLVDGGRLVGIDEIVQKLIHIFCGACHTMTEYVIGIGLEAQKLCQLSAQVDQSLTDFQVVLLVVVDADGISRHVHLLAEFALGRVGHERRVAREVEGEDPSLFVLLLCIMGCGSDGGLRESVEQSLIGDMQGVSLVFLQQILRELEGEHACLLGELAQLLLAFLIEQGTAAHESVVAGIEEHLFLGIELTVRMIVNELDALEELLVQGDIVGMLGEDWTQFLCQFFHLIAGFCTHHAREYIGNTTQEIVIMFPFLGIYAGNGILEGRLCRVIDNLVCGLVIASDTFHESLFVITELDAVERDCIMWGAIGQEERILSLLGFVILCGIIILHNFNCYLLINFSSECYLLINFSSAGMLILPRWSSISPLVSSSLSATDTLSRLTFSSCARRSILMWKFFSPAGRRQ